MQKQTRLIWLLDLALSVRLPEDYVPEDRSAWIVSSFANLRRLHSSPYDYVAEDIFTLSAVKSMWFRRENFVNKWRMSRDNYVAAAGII